MGEAVLFDHEHAIGVLTLNRPEALNALTAGMLDRMGEIFAEVEARGEVRVSGAARKLYLVSGMSSAI